MRIETQTEILLQRQGGSSPCGKGKHSFGGNQCGLSSSGLLPERLPQVYTEEAVKLEFPMDRSQVERQQSRIICHLKTKDMMINCHVVH